VEARGQPGEVDLVTDGDAGQDAVAGGGLGLVGVDVDDDEPGWAAGDADAELGVVLPPMLDAALVERCCVEAVAPPAGGQTGAVTWGVGVLTAVAAVPGR
jgi:hypothetical protein